MDNFSKAGGAAELVLVAAGAAVGDVAEAFSAGAGPGVLCAPGKDGAGDVAVRDATVAEAGAGVSVELESTAKATPLRPGPVSKEHASNTSPKDFRTGRRD